jgi:aminoglycoside 6'-N-acetyltransferase I
MYEAPEIRSVRPADAAAWEEMRERLWPSAPGEHASEIAAWFRGAPHPDAETWLALDGAGTPIGFAEARVRSYAEGCVSDRVAYLEGIWVEPDHRGRGIARALVGVVEAWGRERACPEFASDAEIDNESSLAFHRAIGFDEVERIVCFRKAL